MSNEIEINTTDAGHGQTVPVRVVGAADLELAIAGAKIFADLDEQPATTTGGDFGLCRAKKAPKE